MVALISYILIALFGTIFFNIVIYVYPLSGMMYIVVFSLLIFNSYFLGRWSGEFLYKWKKEKRERHEKRFDWYRKMGLQESACLIEPEQAEGYWKWSWEW